MITNSCKKVLDFCSEPDEAQGYDRNGNQEAFSGGSLYSHGEKAYNGGRENLSEDEKGRTGSISLQGG